MNRKGVLLFISVVVGIVLACAILPLGGVALLITMGEDVPDSPEPAISWNERVIEGKGINRVLVLKVEGIIGNGDIFSQEETLSQIRQATEDPLIKAVVLRIDSPGGGVVASNEIHNYLKDLRTKGKPLVVSMGSIAASGGYYIAAPADAIYANPDTLTGSLGVIITTFNYQGTLEKVGMKQIIYKSGEFKDILSPVRDATPEEQQILQGIVDQAYQNFVDVIAEGRNMPREEVLTLADGRIYSGEQALNNSLVDHMGGLREAIAKAKELANLDEALVVQYSKSPSWRAFISAQTEQQAAANDPLGLQEFAKESQTIRLEYRIAP
jgi:protease-4